MMPGSRVQAGSKQYKAASEVADGRSLSEDRPGRTEWPSQVRLVTGQAGRRKHDDVTLWFQPGHSWRSRGAKIGRRGADLRALCGDGSERKGKGKARNAGKSRGLRMGTGEHENGARKRSCMQPETSWATERRPALSTQHVALSGQKQALSSAR